jgi:integrase/recombinase XerD
MEISQSVTYSLITHKGENRIALHFAYSGKLNNRARKNPEARWSRSLQCWHIPDSAENRIKCGLAPALKTKVKEKPAESTTIPAVNQLRTIVNKIPPSPVHDNNRPALDQLIQELQLKAYSSSTIKTYRNEFGAFLATLGKVPAVSLTTARVKDYLQYCISQLRLSENTVHSRINALKFYYEQVLKREKFFLEIPRPKKPMLLPRLLNETELARLFNALRNKKHKAMLFTAYSAGLRVSEIVNLKISDIDNKRMQILVRQAKGKKDRYVNLSPVLLDILRKYVGEYKPRPVEFLFESEQTGGPYPTRTVQQIFHNAKTGAGIRKDVGIHSLRHSFATHLLDKGTDIKYIKDLLGHFNIRTTEIYLHVSKKQLVNIVSPFDDLYNKENIEW